PLVQRVHPVLAVHQQEDHVRFLHRGERLLADAPVHGLVAAFDDPPGIHDEEAPPAPLRVREVAIAGHTRAVVDDREPTTDHAVEEGRLADVRPPDDRDHGKGAAHDLPSARSAAVISWPVATRAGPTLSTRAFSGRLSMKRSSAFRQSAGSSTTSP